MEGLDEAVVLAEEDLNLCPQGRTDPSTSLNNLAIYLSVWYEQLRGRDDLDVAIVLGRGALDLRPRGHPGRSKSLINAALSLRSGERETSMRRCGLRSRGSQPLLTRIP